MEDDDKATIPFVTPRKRSGESIYAIAARDKKAMRLADLLQRANITAAEAERASEADWRLAAEGAGVRPPSKATVEIVIAMLKEREKPL